MPGEGGIRLRQSRSGNPSRRLAPAPLVRRATVHRTVARPHSPPRGAATVRERGGSMYIDTHCHLDAREFDDDRDETVARAVAAGVTMQVLPAVVPGNFETVRALAHRYRLAYALGIH